MATEYEPGSPEETQRAIIEFEARSGSADGCYDPAADPIVFGTAETDSAMVFEPGPNGFNLTFLTYRLDQGQ